jgi:aryl-alcohol dehydrogenase-like predicted oxidoreductase
MQLRYLGNTGLKVSSLCLGTMTFGPNEWGVGSLDEADCKRLVDISLDKGVNFFDTADVYSAGQSEVLLGRCLSGRRDQVVVATKVRGAMGTGPNDVGLSRRHILSACEASLKRLGTDYIDLYQVHCWDSGTPLEETLGALDDLVHQGKIRYFGCSNFQAWQICKALWTSDRLRLQRFVSVQPYYSLAGRDIERELVPLCRDQGLAILPWSPLAGGLLSGKYRRGQERPAEARLTDPTRDFLRTDPEKVHNIVDVLDAVGHEVGASPAQVAIAWLLHRPAVTSVILGARRAGQLEDTLRSADVRLTPDHMKRLEEATRFDPGYPVWMIDWMNQDRIRV